MDGKARAYPTGSVVGLSLLRKNEQKEHVVTEAQKAQQAYLAKMYGGGGGPPEEKKKKKKKKPKPVLGGVRIVDEDVTGFGAMRSADGEDDAEEDEEAMPVLANPEEAEREIRLAERMREGRHLEGWELADDGSDGRAGPRGPYGGQDASPDTSPPRRRRHDSPDPSPPRRPRHDTPDASPPRRGRHDTPDATPPRRQRHDSPDDTSPPRRPQRHDSPDDASPPRRQQQRNDAPDTSPPRRSAKGGAHPPGSLRDVGDNSPPRKRRADDLSPPQRADGAGAGAGVQAKKAKLMSDGTIAGKVSGREVMAEMERKRAAERERFAKMDKSATGQGAATVYRDKEGRVVDEAELKRLREAEKKPKSEAPTWGAGIAQIREAEARREEMEREAAKPFARRADDPELDAAYRERVRFGDPMAHLVKKRAGAPPALHIPAAVAAQMKKRGFVIPEEVPAHSWLKRGVGPPLNRYNIRPGRHWDGVDRSNGFERDMFATRNARAAQASEAFMWSQSDM